MVILRESFGDEVWRAAPAPDLIQSPEFFAASGRRFLSCKLYMPQRLLRTKELSGSTDPHRLE
jgi:hypothetical protein